MSKLSAYPHRPELKTIRIIYEGKFVKLSPRHDRPIDKDHAGFKELNMVQGSF